MANSSILHFPNKTAPASLSLLTTVALYGGIKFSNIFEPHVVATPFVQKLSFTAIGIPSSKPFEQPSTNSKVKNSQLL